MLISSWVRLSNEICFDKTLSLQAQLNQVATSDELNEDRPEFLSWYANVLSSLHLKSLQVRKRPNLPGQSARAGQPA